MRIKIGNFEYSEVWDGTFYKKLSNYPHITDWEMRTLIEFISYERENGRDCIIECEDKQLLSTVLTEIGTPDKYKSVCRPKLITECTACPKRKGCETKYVCHTTSPEYAVSIFKCGSLLSAVRARGKTATELSQESRNAAKDPVDYFDYVMFSWGNCQAGDRLVMERKLKRFPNEQDLSIDFTPGIRFYFKYDELICHPGCVATLDDEAIASVDDFSQVDYEEIYRKVLSMAPSLDSMISDIRRIKPPQYREISQLQYLVKEGNSHARKRMIEMHLRNAVRVALQRAENYDYDIDEAIQLAFIGLISAVDKYDPDKNGAFASYANLYMIQSISREQPTQNASVYYPVHKREEYFTVYPTLHSQGFRSNDVGDCECHEWISEISQVLSCSIEHAKGVFDMLRPMPSLDVAIDVFDRQIRAAESLSVDETTASNYHALSWTPIEAINDSIDRLYTSKQVLRALDTLTSKEKTLSCSDLASSTEYNIR